MPRDQIVVFAVLGIALAMFGWGRLRYDVVALLALLAITVAGVVPADEAFAGFGHPAVIIVASVLVVGRALVNAGTVDRLAKVMSRVGKRPSAQVAAVTATTTAISGVLSSMAAAAILMPVAVRMARKAGHRPSILLMPLAFGSLLGALLTLIGSAPNIIVAEVRAETLGEGFRMFDYTPVGAGVAAAGLMFITFVGWRLIPRREGQASPEELFDIEGYMTEIRLTDGSPLIGAPLGTLERSTDPEVVVVTLVRDGRRMPAPSGFEVLREGDVLIVEADTDQLDALSEDPAVELVGGTVTEELLGSEEIQVGEAVVMPGSRVEGLSARDLGLQWRHGLNLLAIARQGSPVRGRLGTTALRSGDVLLLQGRSDTIKEALPALGLLPLADRRLRVGYPRRIAASLAPLLGAVILSATGTLPVHVAFVIAALTTVIFGLLPLREVYEAIDGSIIVLLAAMIPVGQALETSGGAARIADGLLTLGESLPGWASVAILLAATMILSDLINNAAAAVLMAPIGLGLASGLGASPDPFLMAVAVGASCAFLTPIGHQSNTLVLGPGGYRFGDYWQMGLPLEAVIVAVGTPLILTMWPLAG